MLMLIIAFMAVPISSFAQGRPGGLECSSGFEDPYEIRAAGLRWTLNAEPRTEAEARERVRYNCRAAKGWGDPFGLACRREAETARCDRMKLFHCSGRATVLDRWGRFDGGRLEFLRFGVVYLPENETEGQHTRIQASFLEFCAYAQGRNLFGVIPAVGTDEFCSEALASLKCE